MQGHGITSSFIGLLADCFENTIWKFLLCEIFPSKFQHQSEPNVFISNHWTNQDRHLNTFFVHWWTVLNSTSNDSPGDEVDDKWTRIKQVFQTLISVIIEISFWNVQQIIFFSSLWVWFHVLGYGALKTPDICYLILNK